MIAQTSSRHSFRSLSTYLATPKPAKSGEEQSTRERVLWVTTRNTFARSLKEAAAEMQDTASLNALVEAPCYHLSISFASEDEPAREEMEAVADRLLEDLGLEGHQVAIVAHGDRDHAHMHLMVNRVRPETLLAWDRWQDRPRIERSLREQERARGLRKVPGHLHRTVREGYRYLKEPAPDRAESLSHGAYWRARRREERPFSELIKEVAKEDFERAESWDDLAQRLGRHGLRIEPRRTRGAVVTDGVEHVALSRVGEYFSRPRLERRFDEPYTAYRERKEEHEQNGRRTKQHTQAHKRDGAGRGEADVGAARRGGARRGAGAQARGEEGARVDLPDVWLPVDSAPPGDAGDGRVRAWLAVDGGAARAGGRGAGPAGVADPDAAGAGAREAALRAGLGAGRAGHLGAALADAVAWAEAGRLKAEAEAAKDAWRNATRVASGCVAREEAFQAARLDVREAMQRVLKAPEEAAARFNALVRKDGPEAALRVLEEAPEIFGGLRWNGWFGAEAQAALVEGAQAMRAALGERPSMEEGLKAHGKKKRFWARSQELERGAQRLLEARGVGPSHGIEAGWQRLERQVRARVEAMSEGERRVLLQAAGHLRTAEEPGTQNLTPGRGLLQRVTESVAETERREAARERERTRERAREQARARRGLEQDRGISI